LFVHNVLTHHRFSFTLSINKKVRSIQKYRKIEWNNNKIDELSNLLQSKNASLVERSHRYNEIRLFAFLFQNYPKVFVKQKLFNVHWKRASWSYNNRLTNGLNSWLFETEQEFFVHLRDSVLLKARICELERYHLWVFSRVVKA